MTSGAMKFVEAFIGIASIYAPVLLLASQERNRALSARMTTELNTKYVYETTSEAMKFLSEPSLALLVSTPSVVPFTSEEQYCRLGRVRYPKTSSLWIHSTHVPVMFGVRVAGQQVVPNCRHSSAIQELDLRT